MDEAKSNLDCEREQADERRKRTFLAREGCLVRTHGLSRDDMNGLTGGVVGVQGTDRLVVNLGKGFGQKALRVANLEAVWWYSHYVFMTNVTGVLMSVMYLLVMPFDMFQSMLLWRMTLLAYISHYAMICYNVGAFELSLEGFRALAASRPGQVLLWVSAFLVLGQSCHMLVGALGCYAILSIAAVRNDAIAKPIARIPLVSHLVARLESVNEGLRKVEASTVLYEQQDWSGKPPKSRPAPPVHWLEVAGVCFELFTGVTQLFMIVLSAMQSMAMLVISWRYLGYRYRTPENRSVRIVFNKAREKLDGYFEHRLVPQPVRELYLWAAEYLWGEVMPP
eukprot:TRINITY_DN5868_c0_g1_i1.p1 TRINITY_DN5868_c0_g1~~TRINITY_DN5868_c0_g1_i1.p1  ORF type:complete len:337 (+),score=99.95 TRINITY_DN5868_c0_g1_i1:1034-2044(+)